MKSSITVCDGKYTVEHDDGTGLRCLRYGEPWRDLIGDGMVLALAIELEDARKQRAELLAALQAVVFDLEVVIGHNRNPKNKRTASEVLLRGMECHRDQARAAIAKAKGTP